MKTLVVSLLLGGVATLAFGQDRKDPRGPDRSPAVGDTAPNFSAKVLGKKETIELRKLVEEEKKPVVLIFGSYT
jgi:hypothetical protein